MKKINRAGFSVMEVVVVTAIMSIVGMTFTSLVQNMLKTRSVIDTKMVLDNLRSQGIKAITNTAARAHTDSDHLNFVSQCSPQDPVVPPPNGCGNYFEGVVKFKDPYDSIYIDSTDPNSGFTLAGRPCSTFDMTNGSDECPIRLEILWQSSCVPTDNLGACYQQPKFYLAKFHYRPINPTVSLNIARFNFDENSAAMAINSNIPQSQAACEQQGGLWVAPPAPRPAFCVRGDDWIIEWH